MAELTFLGAGVSYRPAWRWELVRHRGEVAAVECLPEEVVGAAALRDLRLLSQAMPVLLHGLALSLGSAEGLDPQRLDHLARVVDAVDPPWFSEHIAFTRAGGVEIGHLAPLPFTREAIETVADNVAELRRAVPGLPILLENIAYTIELPGAEMSEAEFVRAVVETADTGLLLDLENVHANAWNHGYDPISYLQQLPLERVAEVHLAGGVLRDGEYADTHSRPVPEESWDLLAWIVRRRLPCAVIIERDDELPPFAELLGEVRRAEAVLDESRRAAAPPGD